MIETCVQNLEYVGQIYYLYYTLYKAAVIKNICNKIEKFFPAAILGGETNEFNELRELDK